MFKKIDHIGIAVQSIRQVLGLYESLLGLKVERIEEIPEQKTRVAVLPLDQGRLELLESMEEDSPVARFLARRGQGLHHVCIQVDDIDAELRRLRAGGVRLIDEEPRRGASGCLIAFVHPESAAGVLVELSQAAVQSQNSSSRE